MVAERRPNTWVARSVIVMKENEGVVIKLKDIIAAVADAFPEEAGRVRSKPNRSGRDPLTGTISRELWDAANGYVPGFEFVKSGGAAFPGCYFLQGSASPLWGYQEQLATWPAPKRRAGVRWDAAVSLEDKLTLWTEQAGYCVGCGRRDNSLSFFDVDHLIPRALGGPHQYENWQLLCLVCNIRIKRESFQNNEDLREAVRRQGYMFDEPAARRHDRFPPGN